jgi:hypothetical protein
MSGRAAAASSGARGAWLFWGLGGAALAATWWLAAGGALAAGEPLCALRRLAGVECPTCGLTRAMTLLARGAWRESLALHPWALPLALQAFAAWALWGAWLVGRLQVRPDRWIPHVVGANLGALVLLWIARLVGG